MKNIHTGETTSTTAPPLPPVLLHKEEEYEYYKVDIMENVLSIILLDTLNTVHRPLLEVLSISYHL